MLKKVGGGVLILFGAVGLFNLIAEFSFTSLIIGIAFIFIGYKLFTSKPKVVAKTASTNNKKDYPNKDLDGKAAVRKFNVQGVTKDNRQQLILQIIKKHGTEGVGNISFIPEPDNEYDPKAIKIIFDEVGPIGYVPKDRNEEIGKLLAKKIYNIKWFASSFSPDDADGDIYYMEVRLYNPA